jgi:hypothetical protein
MSEDRTISPDQALRRLLDVIADEASENAAFRNRLLLALGTPIRFEGEEDIATMRPQDMVRLYDAEKFKRIYGQLNAAGLKRLITSNNLGSTSDLRGLRAPALLDLLWDRASQE